MTLLFGMKSSITIYFLGILLIQAFGFDRTDDYFAKITYDITNQHKINLSYWKVDALERILDIQVFCIGMKDRMSFYGRQRDLRLNLTILLIQHLFIH